MGFEITAPAGNFLDKLLFGPVMLRKGRMFIALLSLLMLLQPRSCQRPQCWETVQEKLYTFCFEWLVSILRTHAGVQKERAQSILYEQWENLATCVDKINISMTIQVWNITSSWFLLKTISVSFCNTTHYFPMHKYSNTLLFHMPSWSGSVFFSTLTYKLVPTPRAQR